MKCYRCGGLKKADCTPESNGELVACTYDDDVCYKYVATKRMDNAKDTDIKVGESRHRGCGPYKKKHTQTPTCQVQSEHSDICYCNTDRCNAHVYEPAQ